MLVLSRKQAQSLWINGNVFVTVLEIRGNKVRLGIEAPKDTAVHRGEVYQRIKGRPGLRLVAVDTDLHSSDPPPAAT